MGDSYSAGNGAGANYGPLGCWRSRRNYGELFAAGIAARFGWTTDVKTVACSGATTADIANGKDDRPPEIDAANDSFDMVMLTLGGNDAFFKDIVKYCLIAKTRDGVECDANLDRAERLIGDGTIEQRVTDALRLIRSRVGDSTPIVLVGYPFLEGDEQYTLRTGHFGHGILIKVGQRLHALNVEADAMDQRIVDSLGPSLHHFVSVQKLFNGPPYHGLYAKKNNPSRWMVQPFVDGSLAASHSTWYHPNPTGWKREAQLLLDDEWVASAVESRGGGVRYQDTELMPPYAGFVPYQGQASAWGNVTWNADGTVFTGFAISDYGTGPNPDPPPSVFAFVYDRMSRTYTQIPVHGAWVANNGLTYYTQRPVPDRAFPYELHVFNFATGQSARVPTPHNPGLPDDVGYLNPRNLITADSSLLLYPLTAYIDDPVTGECCFTQSDLYLLDTQTQTSTRITTGRDGAADRFTSGYAAGISENGRYIAYMGDSARTDGDPYNDVLYVLDRQTEVTRVIPQVGRYGASLQPTNDGKVYVDRRTSVDIKSGIVSPLGASSSSRGYIWISDNGRYAVDSATIPSMCDPASVGGTIFVVDLTTGERDDVVSIDGCRHAYVFDNGDVMVDGENPSWGDRTIYLRASES